MTSVLATEIDSSLCGLSLQFTLGLATMEKESLSVRDEAFRSAKPNMFAKRTATSSMFPR